jgi:hypothetical protein
MLFFPQVSFNAKAANLGWILRALDLCVEQLGQLQLRPQRDSLVDWIIKHQIYAAPAPHSCMFVGFFEDFVDADEVNIWNDDFGVSLFLL